jgi:hypothetical protein
MSVKDIAKKGLAQGTELARTRTQAFREESPYFQAKVALVAAWLAISVATLVVAPPELAPFIVEQKAINFGLANKTTLIVFNQDGAELEQAVVEVSGVTVDFDGRRTRGTWATRPIALPRGLKTTLATESFFDGKGISPGYQLDINQVRILDRGDAIFAGPPTKPGGLR